MDGSLVTHISSLQGLKLLDALSEEERFEAYQNRKRQGYSGGIAGINSTLYRGELGNMDFTWVLNLLSLNAKVYASKVKIEGLIPLEIPMDDVTISNFKVGRGGGASKINSLRTST